MDFFISAERYVRSCERRSGRMAEDFCSVRIGHRVAVWQKGRTAETKNLARTFRVGGSSEMRKSLPYALMVTEDFVQLYRT